MHKFVGEGYIYFFVVSVVAKKLHLSVFKIEAFLRREQRKERARNERKKTYI